jgi:hypothetical protein
VTTHSTDRRIPPHQGHAVKFLLLALLLLLPGAAFAQRTCDQSRASITTGTLGPVEKVAGIPNKRIYICGYIIMPVGPANAGDLDFELTTSSDAGCTRTKAILLPRMRVPANGIVNRIAWAAEATPPGHSICLQTWGTGGVTSVFYWAQF